MSILRNASAGLISGTLEPYKAASNAVVDIHTAARVTIREILAAAYDEKYWQNLRQLAEQNPSKWRLKIQHILDSKSGLPPEARQRYQEIRQSLSQGSQSQISSLASNIVGDVNEKLGNMSLPQIKSQLAVLSMQATNFSTDWSMLNPWLPKDTIAKLQSTYMGSPGDIAAEMVHEVSAKLSNNVMPSVTLTNVLDENKFKSFHK